MSLRYFRGDERPYWQGTVTVDGVKDDMSTGYTFTVKVATSLNATAVVNKTSGITGAAAGVFTVAWTASELDLTPGNYIATCTARRTSDQKDWTVSEPLEILALPS